MKNLLEAPFVREICRLATNMYRLGWDERNGGNISYLLSEEEVKEWLDVSKELRLIPLAGVENVDFDVSPLKGKVFLVTGTGKYFKNVEFDPEENLGIVRVREDGQIALLWGYRSGGRFTSEFPAHMMCHISRLSKNPKNRIVMHCHPTNLLAMTYVHPLTDRDFSRTLWTFATEDVVVFPDGIGVLPWMLCGTAEIGVATAKKMQDYRLVVWSLHGVYGAGESIDEAFGLIETAEKAAQIYHIVGSRPVLNRLSEANLKELIHLFKIEDQVKWEFFDDPSH